MCVQEGLVSRATRLAALHLTLPTHLLLPHPAHLLLPHPAHLLLPAALKLQESLGQAGGLPLVSLSAMMGGGFPLGPMGLPMPLPLGSLGDVAAMPRAMSMGSIDSYRHLVGAPQAHGGSGHGPEVGGGGGNTGGAGGRPHSRMDRVASASRVSGAACMYVCGGGSCEGFFADPLPWTLCT